MVSITEVAENLYEIQPEGNGLDRFPLCTVYLIVDDEPALVEAGCAVQGPEITNAIERILGDLNRVSYLAITHAHPDHFGAAAYLTQKLPNAKIIVHPGAARSLADSSVIEKIMGGFKKIFGEAVEERLGVVLSVTEDKFAFLQDGESIFLGKRELKAIHTPGHDAHHLCFLDTMSEGLFCGDALGAYFSEIDLVIPPHIPGTDFDATLKSIEKLSELHLAQLSFSHGCTVKDAGRYIEMAADNLKNSQNTVYEGLSAGEDIGQIAHKMIDVLAGASESVKSELLRTIHLSVMGVHAYRLFFKKMNMI